MYYITAWHYKSSHKKDLIASQHLIASHWKSQVDDDAELQRAQLDGAARAEHSLHATAAHAMEAEASAPELQPVVVAPLPIAVVEARRRRLDSSVRQRELTFRHHLWRA